MNIIIFGPPAAGKGVQSKILTEQGFIQLSTGEMLREEIRNKSPLGLSIAASIAEGKYVSDETVCKLIEKHLNILNQTKIIFDGFPRTVNQARLLDDMVTVNFVIELKVDPEAMAGRIAVRYLEQKRPEDHPDAFQTRLQEFYEKTLPVLDYYKDQGKVRTVDGMADIETVSSAISAHVGWG
jgi:adenylate kinase